MLITVIYWLLMNVRERVHTDSTVAGHSGHDRQ